MLVFGTYSLQACVHIDIDSWQDHARVWMSMFEIDSLQACVYFDIDKRQDCLTCLALIIYKIVSVFDIDSEELNLDWYRSESSFMSKAFTTEVVAAVV